MTDSTTRPAHSVTQKTSGAAAAARSHPAGWRASTAWPTRATGRRIPRMSDESIAARIERLVTEEQDLRRRERQDSPDADALEGDRERLRAVEVELDRCWDLLRQRRAREEFGLDPDDASARGADTVEHYEQ